MDEGGSGLMKGPSGPVPMGLLDSNYSASGDDLDWADSCLIKLSQASDADWSSFEESLLKILNGPTEPVSLLTDEDGSYDCAGFGDNQPFPSGETMKTPMLTDEGSDFTDDEEDSQDSQDDADDDDSIYKKKKKWLMGNIVSDEEDSQDGQGGAVGDTIYKKKQKWLKGKIASNESPLLPGHSEFPKAESSDLEFDFGSASFEHETTSSQDIFKVWDLGVSVDQDEFTKKLDEALEESTIALNSIVSELQLDFTIQSVDDLIAGLSELSLGQSSI